MKIIPRLISVVALSLLAIGQSLFAQPTYYNWTTFAGLAEAIGRTDRAGSTARFYWPISVTMDSADNIYVADTGNNTIRKVTPGGEVSTIGGLAGTQGIADGTGSSARFYHPFAIAVGTMGNIYVADSGNNTIRLGTTNSVPGTAPWIAIQPSGNTNIVGNTESFSVVASGTEPLNYQWQSHGTNIENSDRIGGSQGITLTISNVEPSDAGDYVVVITNAYGSVTSDVACLAVSQCLPPPASLANWWPADGNSYDIVGNLNAMLEGNATFKRLF